MTTFNEALAEHGSAKEAITEALFDAWYKFDGMAHTAFEAVVAPWILANAAAIAAHQSGRQNDTPSQLLARIQAVERASEDRDRLLSIRLQALEDAPGPRPNAEEVAALRQRMDSLTELLQKQAKLDRPWEDALARVERDVALLMDDRSIRLIPASKPVHISAFMQLFGAELRTPEARKIMGLDVATPEPEPVYKWVGNHYCRDNFRIGTVAILFTGKWAACCETAPAYIDTFATPEDARVWVEAQFNSQKP